MSHPWKSLTEAFVLDSVESVIGRKLSNVCIQRNSYINRVFELQWVDGSQTLIAKFYRPSRWTREMIDTEQNFVATLSRAELPVIAPLRFGEQSLFQTQEFLFALFPKKGGRAIDEFDKETWLQVGRLLGRTHLISATLPPTQRIEWRPAVASTKHLEILAAQGLMTPEFQKPLFSTCQAFIKRFDPLFDDADRLILHGDCHRGNLIYRPDEGIYLIDFDDMASGPAVQDLWMLLPGTPEQCEQELAWFLEGYETFRDFPRSSLSFTPALRGMRLIHFAAWCALQADEPEFINHFPEWGSSRYWNELIKDLQELVWL